MRLTSWIGVVAIVAATTPALADIFVWRDGAGISHYTNELANVPVEFRKDAMTVAKEWARAMPPPEPVAAQPVAAAISEDSAVAPRDTYEAAYAAGYRAAAGDEDGGTINNVGTVVQNVQVEPSAPGVVDRLVPVPVIVERRHGRAPAPRDEARSSLSPAQRAPYIQGPAGPPPISDR